MDELAGIALIGLLVMVFVGGIGAVGAVLASSSWENDCEKLGMTRSSGKVYECRLKQ